MEFFLVSLSDSFILAYKNASDLWILIFYPDTSQNLFIRSNIFLVYSLGFSVYGIMSSANKDNHITSSFPIWIPFISSPCLIAVARTSSNMLNNKSDRTGHSCLVPDLKRKAFSF